MRETEKRSQAGSLDELSIPEVLRVMNQADASIVPTVGEALPSISPVVETAIGVLSEGGRLIYVGAGSSGRLGVLDAAECIPTFGIEPGRVVGVMAGREEALETAREGVEDDEEAGSRSMRDLEVGADDLVVGISASGITPYTLSALLEARDRGARDRGARTAAIVNVADSEIGEAVDYPVEVLTGTEVLAGSTRLKAGTGQKIVLNMISTATMVGLGYVYENLMVGVLPHNSKLRERAERIVQEITDREPREVRDALDRAENDVRVAVLLLDGSATVQESRHRLQEARGSLRRAREQSPSA